ELARTVAGRGLTPSISRTRSTTHPATPAPQANMLGDLEAEMMGNLQASFTAVNDAPPAPPADAEPAPPTTPVAAPPAKPTEGIVRDRLTDALAALAPVLKFDRPLDTEQDGPAPAGARPGI